jgi:hypothetical protein
MGIVRFALKFPYTFHVLDTFMSAHPLRPPLNFRHDDARRERQSGPQADIQ